MYIIIGNHNDNCNHRDDGPAIPHTASSLFSGYFYYGTDYTDIPSDEYWIKFVKKLDKLKVFH